MATSTGTRRAGPTGITWHRKLPSRVQRFWYFIYDSRLDEYSYPYAEVDGRFADHHGEVRVNLRGRQLLNVDEDAVGRVRTAYGPAALELQRIAWAGLGDDIAALAARFADLTFRVSRRELDKDALSRLVTELADVRRAIDQLESYALDQMLRT